MRQARAVTALFLATSWVFAACDTSEPRDTSEPGEHRVSTGFPGNWHTVTEIGVMDGPPESEVFGPIRHAVVMESGGLTVLDVQSSRISGFDAEGRHTFSFGRSGSGPGEFTDPTGLLRIADDTLAVVSRAKRLIQYFVPDSVGTFVEAERSALLPLWPNGSCVMGGRIFVLGYLEESSVHEVDRDGSVRRSFSGSELGEWAEEGAPESVAWAWRDAAVSGRLVCSEDSQTIIHIPYNTGWVRAYTLGGDLAWHAPIRDFARVLILPAAGGGVKYNFDPDLKFSHDVTGAAEVEQGVLGISVEKNLPRGQEPSNEGLLVLLDIETGIEVGREVYGGILLDGSSHRTAVTHDLPFPKVTVLAPPTLR